MDVVRQVDLFQLIILETQVGQLDVAVEINSCQIISGEIQFYQIYIVAQIDICQSILAHNQAFQFVVVPYINFCQLIVIEVQVSQIWVASDIESYQIIFCQAQQSQVKEIANIDRGKLILFEVQILQFDIVADIESFQLIVIEVQPFDVHIFFDINDTQIFVIQIQFPLTGDFILLKFKFQMRAQFRIGNFKWMAFEFVPPYFEVIDKVKCNQSAHIELFAYLSASVVNGDNLPLGDNGAATVSAQRANRVGDLTFFMVDQFNLVLVRKSVLIQADALPFLVQGFVVILILPGVPKDFQFQLFVFLQGALRASIGQNRKFSLLREIFQKAKDREGNFGWLLQLEEGVVEWKLVTSWTVLIFRQIHPCLDFVLLLFSSLRPEDELKISIFAFQGFVVDIMSGGEHEIFRDKCATSTALAAFVAKSQCSN